MSPQVENRHISGTVLKVETKQFMVGIVGPYDETEIREWIGIDYVVKAELNNEWTEEEMIDP